MHLNVRAAAVFASIGIAFAYAPASAGDDPGADPQTSAAAKVTVQVVGRVTKPGKVMLDSGARLSDALTAADAFAIERLVARAGGAPVPDTECTPGGTQLRFFFLTRAAESSAPRSYAIEFATVRQHDPRYDMLLRPNDTIVVPQCRALTQPRIPIPAVDPERSSASAVARTPPRAS